MKTKTIICLAVFGLSFFAIQVSAYSPSEYVFFEATKILKLTNVETFDRERAIVTAEGIAFNENDLKSSSRVLYFSDNISTSNVRSWPHVVSNQSVFQFKLKEKTLTLVLLNGSRDEVKELLRGIQAAYPNISLVGSRTVASEVGFAEAQLKGPLVKQDGGSEISVQFKSFLRNSYSCYVEGLPSGVKSALVDPFVNGSKSLYGLATDYGQWIKNSRAEIETAYEFFSDFRAKLGKSWEEYKRKPPTEQTKDLCSFFSSSLTAGGAAVRFQSVLAQQISKTSKVPVQVLLGNQADLRLAELKPSADSKSLVEVAKQYPKSIRVTPGKDGKSRVEILMLRGEEKELNVALLRALRSGQINKIETGDVIAPKSLILIDQLRREALEKQIELTISGYIRPGALIRNFNEDLQLGLDSAGNIPKGFLTEKDRINFEEALKNLKIKEGCKRVYTVYSLNACGPIRFEFSSRDQNIRHSQAVTEVPLRSQ